MTGENYPLRLFTLSDFCGSHPPFQGRLGRGTSRPCLPEARGRASFVSLIERLPSLWMSKIRFSWGDGRGPEGERIPWDLLLDEDFSVRHFQVFDFSDCHILWVFPAADCRFLRFCFGIYQPGQLFCLCPCLGLLRTGQRDNKHRQESLHRQERILSFLGFLLLCNQD